MGKLISSKGCNAKVAFVTVSIVTLLLGASQVSLALELDPDKDLRAQLLAAEFAGASGGDTTVDTDGPRAFRSIAPNAANKYVAPFLFGQRIFDIVWEYKPDLQPTTDGLGPVYNRAACRECHDRNGRGGLPAETSERRKAILVRISIPGESPHGGPNPVPGYGDQLQERAIPGVPPEGQSVFRYEEIPGSFADGTPFSLRKPKVAFANLAYGDLPADVLSSARVAPPVIGLGLLQAIPEANLRALADPDDSNGDGISGRVNMAWDAKAEKLTPGRFGWKANVPTVRQQNAGAALGDMGITSSINPQNLCEDVQQACIAMAESTLATAGSPEMADEILDALEVYALLVSPPRQRNADDPAVQRGEQLFRGIGCSGCHMPTQVSGDSDIAALANQVFHPFSDLLVHDMGEGLADNRPDFGASGREWRTQPLWGIGLTKDVITFESFLHDGRARTLSEAILWHGGEAAGPREVFRNLSEVQRDNLIAFLKSL
jgi:CxxC motif-containing protein (DUF1111 family)